MFRAEDGAAGREPQGAGSRAEFVRGIILASGLLSGCSFFLARTLVFVRLPSVVTSMKCFSACLFLVCSAVHPAVASTNVPLLREAALNLSYLGLLVEDPFEKVIPQVLLGLLCTYEDQLGGPVFYEEAPKELVCTDSTGKELKVYRVSADADRAFGVGHGDPVCFAVAVQRPDPGAEWVRLRGFLLCAFADDLVELPAVVLPLPEEEAQVELPLEKPRKDMVTLTLKKSFKLWTLKVKGKSDFYFNSFNVRDENGLPLKGRPGLSSRGREVRMWRKDYRVPARSRSLRVVVSYWNKRMFRKVPVDMKIGLGGAAVSDGGNPE